MMDMETRLNTKITAVENGAGLSKFLVANICPFKKNDGWGNALITTLETLFRFFSKPRTDKRGSADALT